MRGYPRWVGAHDQAPLGAGVPQVGRSGHIWTVTEGRRNLRRVFRDTAAGGPPALGQVSRRLQAAAGPFDKLVGQRIGDAL
jgi:hypothetical protein